MKYILILFIFISCRGKTIYNSDGILKRDTVYIDSNNAPKVTLKDTIFIHDTVIVYDIPQKKKRKIKSYKLLCKNCDTIFINDPLYIETTINGKRIIKIME